MTRTIKLTADQDLDFVGGALSMLEGRAAVAQRLKIRLLTFRGEWFRDLRVGVPYRENILVRNPDYTKIGVILRGEILACPGITGITAFTMDQQPDRRLGVQFTATTDQGDIVATVPDLLSPAKLVLMFDLPGPIIP